MTNTPANAMPARAIPTGEGVLRPVVIFGSRPGVGATTVATVARAALAGGASLPRLLNVGDGLDGPSPDAGADTFDFGSGADTCAEFIRLAEALAEGHVVVDCAAGAAGRVFAEADAVKVGHIIAKRGGVTAVVVVGPSSSSARRALAQVEWLLERGSALGVTRLAAVLVDSVGRKAPWDSVGFEEVHARLAKSKIDVGRIPFGDLDLLTRFGVDASLNLRDADADVAGKLGVSEIEAAARASRLKTWLGHAADGLRGAGVLPEKAAKAAAKAA